MPIVYLSGPISGKTYAKAVNWRHRVARRLQQAGIQAISPMRAKHELLLLFGGNTVLGNYTAYREVLNCSPAAITQRDRFDCMRCDAMLVNLLEAERVSIGTMIELGWADAARRPIVVCDTASSLHAHPIVEGIAGWIVPDLRTAVEVLVGLLAPYTAPIFHGGWTTDENGVWHSVKPAG